jgi:hypothetical protein
MGWVLQNQKIDLYHFMFHPKFQQVLESLRIKILSCHFSFVCTFSILAPHLAPSDHCELAVVRRAGGIKIFSLT